MSESSKKTENTSGGSNGDIPRKFNISGGEDLPDNPHDAERLKSETTYIDLPDVEDIPGQENVRPAPMGELADTTISSDDEEGVGLFDDEEDDDDLIMSTGNDVSEEEKKALQQADEDMPTRDDDNLHRAALDNVDEDGEPLNEAGFGDDVSGGDLDVSGAEVDDPMEDIGSEDEENNQFSTPDNDDNDNANQ
jgi:hypothetical protein